MAGGARRINCKGWCLWNLVGVSQGVSAGLPADTLKPSSMTCNAGFNEAGTAVVIVIGRVRIIGVVIVIRGIPINL